MMTIPVKGQVIIESAEYLLIAGLSLALQSLKILVKNRPTFLFILHFLFITDYGIILLSTRISCNVFDHKTLLLTIPVPRINANY